MIEIKEYDDCFAENISKLIIQNLLEVNLKDYDLNYITKTIEDFSIDKIKNNFSKRTKVYVAFEDNVLVGTAGLDKSLYNDDGEYWILSVFVDVLHHGKGIGKMLIRKIEDFALAINAKKLIVPASITACEFYHKLGYEYLNGKKTLNDEQYYIMEKYLLRSI